MTPMFRGDVTHFVVHHSATRGGTVEAIRRGHLDRGFEDIGYHWVIGDGRGMRDGATARGRPENLQGAGVWGNNAGKLHVCLVGNFEVERPTAAQLDALGRLLHKWQVTYGVKPVVGHREVTLPGHGTACPGRNFPLDRVRAWMGAEVKCDLGDWLLGRELPREVLVPPSSTPKHQWVASGEATPEVKSIRVVVEVASSFSGHPPVERVNVPGLLVGGVAHVSVRALADAMRWESPEWSPDSVVIHTRRRRRESRDD